MRNDRFRYRSMNFRVNRREGPDTLHTGPPPTCPNTLFLP